MFKTMQLLNIIEGLVHTFKGQFASMRTNSVFWSVLLLSVIIYCTAYNLVELSFDLTARTIIIATTSLIIGAFFALMKWPRKSWTHHKRIENTENRNFFQLMKLSVDISTEVLRRVVDTRILTLYGSSLEKFLEDKKHFLFHQWQGSTPCCECLPAGCSMVKSKKLKKRLFEYFFTDNRTPQRGHVKKVGYRISEYCLHCFVTNSNLIVDNLDITILSFLMEHFVRLSPKERSAFGDIVSTRNAICHARKTNCFDSKELENMWKLLRDASLTLTDLPYRKLLKDQIDMLKKVEFDNSDIEILREKLEHEDKMLAEIYDCINQNNITLKETGDIIVSHVDTTKRCVEDEAQVLKEGQRALSSQQKETNEKLAVVLQSIKSMEAKFHIYAENKCLSEHSTSESIERSICAVGRIDDKSIDERSVVENITKNSNENEDHQKFMVESAKQSCIILNLACSPKVLKDEKSLQFALKSLLCDIVTAGNVDTDSPSTLVVQLIFCSPLTALEINIIKSSAVKSSNVKCDESVNANEVEEISPDLKRDAECFDLDRFQRLDIYKVSSGSQVLTSINDHCFIILTNDSYLPNQSDIEVRIMHNRYYTQSIVSPTVIKNVIEFKLPLHVMMILPTRLFISIFDKKRKIETSKQVLKVDIDIDVLSLLNIPKRINKIKEKSIIWNDGDDDVGARITERIRTMIEIEYRTKQLLYCMCLAVIISIFLSLLLKYFAN